MEVNEMNLMEVNERLAILETEVREMTEVADVEKATEEKQALLSRNAELEEVESRKAIAEELNNGTTTAEKVVEQREEIKQTMENKILTVADDEYRSAFYSNIAGTATAEQRSALITADGDAIAIPKSLDEKIWDNIHANHPILSDIVTVASGVVMEVTKHTAIAVRVTKKKDTGADVAAEDNTFVKVSLAGNDYNKYVELTYAEAKMSQGALEDYLAQEISAELGEALAKDVFAQILTDCGDTQKVTATDDLFADIKSALGLANLGGKKVIYAPSSAYYNIVGAIKNGSPFNIGNTLGVEVRCDDAAENVVVLDPKSFVLNEVQGITIESDKDLKAHKVVVSGYLRAEGCLRNNKAAAYIG